MRAVIHCKTSLLIVETNNDVGVYSFSSLSNTPTFNLTLQKQTDLWPRVRTQSLPRGLHTTSLFCPYLSSLPPSPPAFSHRRNCRGTSREITPAIHIKRGQPISTVDNSQQATYPSNQKKKFRHPFRAPVDVYKGHNARHSHRRSKKSCQNFQYIYHQAPTAHAKQAQPNQYFIH